MMKLILISLGFVSLATLAHADFKEKGCVTRGDLGRELYKKAQRDHCDKHKQNAEEVGELKSKDKNVRGIYTYQQGPFVYRQLGLMTETCGEQKFICAEPKGPNDLSERFHHPWE